MVCILCRSQRWKVKRMERGQTVCVVTDSSSGLTKDMETASGINVVPLWVQLGNESFREGVDISAQEFYGKLDGQTMPVTSAPAPGEFVRIYKSLAKKASDILSIHITAKGSSTCQTARLAAQSVPEARVTVYDSQTISMGTGFLAMEAARAAQDGLKLEEILARLDKLKAKIRVYAAIPTLEYLRRSGRVTQGQALLASLLSIKPVLEVIEGEVRIVDRVRTYPRALERMLELACDAVGSLPARVAVMHTNCFEGARKFADAVAKRIKVEDLFIGEAGAALAVHGGPGLVGIALYPVH